MTENQQASESIEVEFVDLPEVKETFVDNIRAVHVDGSGLRIEFCVTRLDPFKPGEKARARSYPACRLVIAGPAAVDLINKMQQVGASMAEKGLARAEHSGPAPRPNP